MVGQQAQGAAGGAVSGWNKIPAEVIGNIMSNLKGRDLKASRLVDKATSSAATPFLFQTLCMDSNWKGLLRAKQFLKAAHLATHVRALEYRGNHGDEFDHPMLGLMPDLSGTRIKSAEFTNVNGVDLYTLVAGDAAVCRFLPGVEQFRLTYQEDAPECTPIGHYTFQDLANQLSSVKDLSFGFKDLEHCNCRDSCPSSMRFMASMVQCYFPQLHSLTLEHGIFREHELLDFLHRHRETLTSLTLVSPLLLRGPDLEVRDSDGPDQGLASVMSLILSLHQKARLNQLSFQDCIYAGDVELDYPQVFHDVRILCHGVGQRAGSRPGKSKEPPTGTLCRQVEEYICHRAEFPFPSLQPHLEAIMGGRANSDGGDFLIEGEYGAEAWLSTESDDSWVVQRFEY